jgi:hypothetical protein
MEDLIPLIIVIAISIFAASRKKKRQEERNISNPDHQTSRDDEIFNWLEKLGIEENEVSPFQPEKSIIENHQKLNIQETPVEEVKAPVREIIPNKYSRFGGFITPEEREQLMSKEGISSLKPKKDVNDLTQKVNEDTIKESEKQKNVFDLRQAVVFSEILNRKYV